MRGALISEGVAAGDASLDRQRDADVLEALRTRQGSFVAARQLARLLIVEGAIHAQTPCPAASAA